MTAMTVLSDKRQNAITDMAIATRAASMEKNDFMKFIGTKPMGHDEIFEKHQADAL